jgi:hypothetical protein
MAEDFNFLEFFCHLGYYQNQQVESDSTLKDISKTVPDLKILDLCQKTKKKSTPAPSIISSPF